MAHGIDKPDEFQCWDPETGDEEGAGYMIGYANPANAARAWAEARYSGDDCPQRRTVMVRAFDGTLTAFEVEARESVDFYAHPRPVSP